MFFTDTNSKLQIGLENHVENLVTTAAAIFSKLSLKRDPDLMLLFMLLHWPQSVTFPIYAHCCKIQLFVKIFNSFMITFLNENSIFAIFFHQIYFSENFSRLFCQFKSQKTLNIFPLKIVQNSEKIYRDFFRDLNREKTRILKIAKKNQVIFFAILDKFLGCCNSVLKDMQYSSKSKSPLLINWFNLDKLWISNYLDVQKSCLAQVA